MEVFPFMAGVERRVIVVAHGDVDAHLLADLARATADEQQAPYVIAADGGAARALAAGLRPDLVLGDGDSLTDSVRQHLRDLGVEVRLVAADKDESDTELCLLAARERGAGRVSIVGALGGPRPEHSIANLLLLADPRFDEMDLEIVVPDARLVRIGRADQAGELHIEGQAGDYVSLLPLAGRVVGVSTHGLRFPLRGETLEVGPARGLSNELQGSSARVTTERGCLLVVHTTGSGRAPDPEEAADAPDA